MNDAGRKRWWSATAITVLGGGVLLGGWVGLSRSAPPDLPAHPREAVSPADGTWSRAPAPGADSARDEGPAGIAVRPAPVPAMPSIPDTPAIPPVPPGDVIPASLPA